MGYVEVTVKNEIAVVSIKKPGGNLIDRALLRELSAKVSRIDHDSIKGIVLTAQGSAFSKGSDMKEVARLNCSNAKDFSKLGQEAFQVFSRINKPVVAAINGAAIGAGLELALACDVRIAANDIFFQQPEKQMGLVPCFGGSVRLPRLIGRTEAFRFINTGRKLSSDEAHAMGIIDYIVDKKSIMFEAERIILTEEFDKQHFRAEDFHEERKAFSRCFSDAEMRKKLKKKAKL